MMKRKTWTFVCCLSAAVIFSACTKKAEPETAAPLPENPYQEAFKELDSGNWEDAEELMKEQLEAAEEKDYYALIGLARAQLQQGAYGDARDTLLETAELFPEQTGAKYYLAAAYTGLEDYDHARDEYYELVKEDDSNESLIDAMLDVGMKSEDKDRTFELSKKIYESHHKRKYMSRLIQACGLFQDEQHENEVLTLVPEEQKETLSLLFRAFHAAKSGNLEEAEEDLVQIGNYDDITLKTGTFYGDITNGTVNGTVIKYQKVFEGMGFVAGSMENDCWNGPCIAVSGSEGTSTRRKDGVIVAEGRTVTRQTYTGEWMNGFPEGEVFHKRTWESTFDDPQYNNKDYGETTLNCVAGKAEGHTETIEYYYNVSKKQLEPDRKVIHEFKEGKPQPFKANTKDGELDVYEFTTSLDGYDWNWYESTDCGHEYIWTND